MNMFDSSPPALGRFRKGLSSREHSPMQISAWQTASISLVRRGTWRHNSGTWCENDVVWNTPRRLQWIAISCKRN